MPDLRMGALLCLGNTVRFRRMIAGMIRMKVSELDMIKDLLTIVSIIHPSSHFIPLVIGQPHRNVFGGFSCHGGDKKQGQDNHPLRPTQGYSVEDRVQEGSVHNRQQQHERYDHSYVHDAV